MVKGFSGSALKMIAMMTMLIDHIGAVVFARMILATRLNEAEQGRAGAVLEWMSANVDLYDTYTLFRAIGRIAFPIFCFLLVEGFAHTSNARKYVIRLLVFALISEIPFDLAFKSQLLEFGSQNVFFTLAIGFVTLMVYKKVEESNFQNKMVQILCQLFAGIIGMGAAELLQTDYSAMGVLVILMFYVLRENRFYQIVAGGILFLENASALFAFLPISIYNGKRGLNVKWAFYIFYPAHLLILFVISHFLGLSAISVI